MLLRRIHCHFCGSRQPHSRSVTEFQCSNCEAVNFFDGKGNVVDTPASLVSQNALPQSRPQSFTRPLAETLAHQHTTAFCRACSQNQLLYNETLANYLPDESHPQYRQYEAAIPAYKKELEKRYPLVCKKCAPLAQSKINRADHYGMTQNARKLLSATRARGGLPARRTRDDWYKKTMRLICNLITMSLHLGLLIQIAYHAYGIMNIISGGPSSSEIGFDDSTVSIARPSVYECAQQSVHLNFRSSCHHVISNLTPFTLAWATFFLWHNPGIKAWYDHTYRMEAVNGQRNYFYMQIITLLVRTWAWYNLSSPNTTSYLDREQLIALHGFVVLFVLLTQYVANRSIKPVRWTMKGKIMPHPGERDILSDSAGPSPEHYTPKASESDPWKYLRKPESEQFDINLLAPKPPKQPYFTRTSYLAQQPSPEISDEEGDYDAMETDHNPVMRSSQHFTRSSPHIKQHSFSNASGIGFGSMTDQVFNMQTQIRQEEERKRREQEQKLRFQPPTKERSPFYGHLPPAPMSMERRLRNPVITPVEPQRLPLSQQKDFMSQMRAGVKPVQFPQKGTNFELRKSDWHLPGDVKETGLEDRFTKTFSLADPAPPGQEGKRGFLGFFGR